MAQSTPSIDEICAQAALRNVALRQATKQASETLTTALKLVAGTTEVPEEFLPKIASPAPKLKELLSLVATPEPEPPTVAKTPKPPPPSAIQAPPAPPAPLIQPAKPISAAPQQPVERKIGFEPVQWPTFGAAPPTAPTSTPSPPAAASAPATHAPEPEIPNLGPNEVFFPPGQLLFNKGDAADRFYVIRQGQVGLFEPSTQKQIATLGPGTSFGEQAILVGGVRSVSARAIDGVVCLALSADTLREMLELEKGTIKPVFEALLLQLYLHNDLHARGHRYNA
ncbi:MAG: hypothetical protein RLZZ344_158 [Pseudomonadota bacterium]|jgi:hypothetical protein